VVAIDIGTDSVHAVEVHFEPEPRIVKRGSANLPSPVWEELALHKDALTLAVKTAMASAGISATQVMTVIPRRMATLKYARLPHAEADQIRSMVEFEAQQYVPFPLEEVVIGHQVVSDDMDEMMTVMIVAARLSLVETLLSVFDKVGLEVSHISVSALALAEHARGAALPVALLEADGPELDLAVVNADKLLFSRAASLNGTRAISGTYGEQLTAEIARSLAAYQNEHRSAPVSRVLIAGPASNFSDFQQALDGLLDIPVGPLTSPLLPASDPSSAAYAVASGIALQAGGGGISSINLVPPSREERKVAARKRTNSLVALLAVAVVAGAAIVFVKGLLDSQTQERKDAEAANRKLNIAKSAVSRTNGEYDRVRKSYEIVSGGMGRKKPMVDVVKAVSDALPRGGGVYLTQLSFERGATLTVHGNAATEVAATDLVIALQSSGAFRDVRLNYLGDSSVDLPASTGPKTASTTTAAATKPAGPMSFLVTAKVLLSEPKDLGDLKAPKRTATASLDNERRTQ
jgi:type IV pilus assembly protein PilM